MRLTRAPTMQSCYFVQGRKHDISWFEDFSWNISTRSSDFEVKTIWIFFLKYSRRCSNIKIIEW
jgi:hypothetical protein